MRVIGIALGPHLHLPSFGFIGSVWFIAFLPIASLGKCQDRLFSLSKKTDQNRNDVECGKKTQCNCNRHGPIFPPSGFELMSNSSPKRFFASIEFLGQY